MALERLPTEVLRRRPGLGDLPLLYVHGGDDGLVPVELARPVVERLAGPDSELRVLDGARHEVFNEVDKDETIALVATPSPSGSRHAERACLAPCAWMRRTLCPYIRHKVRRVGPQRDARDVDRPKPAHIARIPPTFANASRAATPSACCS